MNRRGKDSRLGGSVDATFGKLGAVSKAVVAGATSAVGDVQDAAGKTLESATAQSKGVFNDKLLEKVSPECPVPAFMLPTGPSPDDYRLIFELDEMLDNLESGILVRPKIHIWAARESGHNLEHFGEELIQGFVCQFNETRDRLTDEGRLKIDSLERRRQRLSDEIKAEASGRTLRSATRWAAMGIVWLPLVPLGLSFGLKPRTELIGLIRDYLKVGGDKKQAQRELARKAEELESRFDKKDKAFQRAVANIEIRVHPRIRSLAISVCDAAGVAFYDDGSEPECGEVPDLEPYLRASQYREHIPYRYQWLLTVKPRK